MPRMTLQTKAVLAALLDNKLGEAWGFELSKTSGLAAGTIYPILQRLTSAGWIHSRWENAEAAQREGRPPRRYYTLTTEGRARAVHVLGTRTSGHDAVLRLLNRPETS